MTPQVLGALLIGAVLAATGQILLKVGATGRLALVELINLYVLAGLAIFSVAVVFWLYALARLPLYAVYPFNVLTLGIMFVSSLFILGERPSALTIAGWAVVVAGLVLVAMGTRSHT